jgi:pimeloyl-ACP methyl ester carboxylesterase
MPALNVNARALHYVETGAGAAALVLVHGAGGSHATWTRQLEGLANAARVIALDLPGHGGSAGEGCRRVADYAAVVRGFLAGLGAGPVVLGGHSMGGAITQVVALEVPAMLRAVVLVGTGARLKVFPRVFELAAQDYAQSVDFITDQAWSPSSAGALVEGGRRALLETGAAVTLGDFRACDAFDLMDRVRGIRQPALVIVGEDDRLTPPRYAEYLARQIHGARLVRIPRAGHHVSLEQPDEVNEAIRDFLATLS